MIGVIIQARMGSRRFPGKVLETIIDDVSLLEFLFKRVKKSIKINKIIVATTDQILDDEIVKIAQNSCIEVFRGDENDVLKRYYEAAKKYELETIIRIPGDNPFISPILIDEMIEFWNKNKEIDYLSNILKPTFPIGMHIEIFNFKTLKVAYKTTEDSIDKEHVTPFIYNNPNLFKLLNFESPKNLSNFRLTVDYPEDLDFCRRLSKILQNKSDASIEEICSIIKHYPSLKKINSMHEKSQIIKRKKTY